MQTTNSPEKTFNIRDFVTFDRNGRAYCPSCEQNKRAISTAQLRKIHQTRLDCALFSPIDVVDFLAKVLEKREWIIAGKIPRGRTIALIADGGTGKSRLSYDLAGCDRIRPILEWLPHYSRKSLDHPN